MTLRPNDAPPLVVGEIVRPTVKFKPRTGGDTIASATVVCIPSGGVTIASITTTADTNTTVSFTATAAKSGDYVVTVTATLASGQVAIEQYRQSITEPGEI